MYMLCVRQYVILIMYRDQGNGVNKYVETVRGPMLIEESCKAAAIKAVNYYKTKNAEVMIF